jgi:CemA family
MESFLVNKFGQYWRKANQWFYRTADRALDEAYKAALKIKAIEDEHFGGDKIEIPLGSTGNQVATYFQTDLSKYLNIARIRLAEFQTSRTITVRNSSQLPESLPFVRGASPQENWGFNSIDPYPPDIDREARILEKLSFIDEILTRYADQSESATDLGSEISAFSQRAIDSLSGLTINSSERIRRDSSIEPANFINLPDSRQSNNSMTNRPERPDDNINKRAIVDPSLIKTFRRIQQDLNPKAEAQVIESYRFHQDKTKTSLRFILILILVPLLVQFLSKIIFIGPAVNLYRSYTHADVFLNVNLEQEAMEELERFEKKLKFKQIVGLTPKLNQEQIDEKFRAKAQEVKVIFYRQSAEAVKNWFADILSIVTFTWLIVNSKQQITILKSFLDDLVSGLSDTAKAFIIILLTDTFVGFHSPHGWEIILAGTAKHLGIAENREFNSLFIATFPVLIDTVFKYWIFRYLTGQSPSAVATYKTMNE